MKIFLSWSGDQARHVAEFLKTWLPTVLASPIETFISSQDIPKGDRGLPLIAQELDQLDYGIAVLTKENLASPWIHFEAGALAKSVSRGRVATVLVDVTGADVEGPLTQFQHTVLKNKADVQQLVRDISKAMKIAVPAETLDVVFEQLWPRLEDELSSVSGLDSPTTSRSSQDLLEEILELVRGIQREVRQAGDSSSRWVAGNEALLRSQAIRERQRRHRLALGGTLPSLIGIDDEELTILREALISNPDLMAVPIEEVLEIMRAKKIQSEEAADQDDEGF